MLMLAGTVLGQPFQHLRKERLRALGNNLPDWAFRIADRLLLEGRGLLDKLYYILLDRQTTRQCVSLESGGLQIGNATRRH